MCDFFVYIKKKQYLCRRVSDVYCDFFLQTHYDDGMWRSPVAQRSGGPEVASSNLVIPTSIEGKGNASFPFFMLSSLTKFI